MRRALVCTALLTGLLAGCRGTVILPAPGPSAFAMPSASPVRSVAPSPSPTPRPSTAPPTATGPTESARPPANDVLVEFGREGGFAGVSDQLTVRQDGRFTLVRSRPAVNRSGRLTTTELANLRGALDRSGFAGLPGVEPGHGNDLYTYLLVYGRHQILAQDGGVAEPLGPVIGALSAIIQKYGA